VTYLPPWLVAILPTLNPGVRRQLHYYAVAGRGLRPSGCRTPGHYFTCTSFARAGRGSCVRSYCLREGPARPPTPSSRPED
jgi:hypothetical protein